MHLSDHSLRQIDDAYLRSLDPEALCGLSLRLLADLKEARERLNQGPTNSSRPSSRRAPWARGETAAEADEAAARRIVADELADYLIRQRQAEVTPTVTALRQRAAEVVEAEMLRLETRLPELDDPARDEVATGAISGAWAASPASVRRAATSRPKRAGASQFRCCLTPSAVRRPRR